MRRISINPEDPLHSSLVTGKACADTIADEVLADKRRLESVLEGVSSAVPRVRFGCAKSLLLLSRKNPKLLYPRIERIIQLLENDNQILKWTAISVLGNLATVDRASRTRDLLPKFFEFLACGELITANHAIAALGKIGSTFQNEQNAIIDRLMGVEGLSFETDECRNIALGKVILALETLVNPANASESLVAFVRRHAGNKRPATAKKAKAFMKKFPAAD